MAFIWTMNSNTPNQDVPLATVVIQPGMTSQAIKEMFDMIELDWSVRVQAKPLDEMMDVLHEECIGSLSFETLADLNVEVQELFEHLKKLMATFGCNIPYEDDLYCYFVIYNYVNECMKGKSHELHMNQLNWRSSTRYKSLYLVLDRQESEVFFEPAGENSWNRPDWTLKIIPLDPKLVSRTLWQ